MQLATMLATGRRAERQMVCSSRLMYVGGRGAGALGATLVCRSVGAARAWFQGASSFWGDSERDMELIDDQKKVSNGPGRGTLYYIR